MNRISRIEEKITAASAILDSLSPGNLADDLSIASLEAHRGELQGELRLAKEERFLEVVELKLGIETPREAGTVSLSLFGKLAQNLSGAVCSAARYLEQGTTGGAVPSEITSQLNLRLAGLGAGSTRIFITGENAPNLFGESLLEDTLNVTFEILESANPGDLIGAVSRAGRSSASNLVKFLHEIHKSGTNSALRWTGPGGKPRQWEASPDEALQLARSMESIDQEEPEEVEALGEIVTISIKRNFELRLADGRELPARVPKGLLGQIEEYHVGQKVRARFTKETTRNKVTGDKRESYVLLSLSSSA